MRYGFIYETTNLVTNKKYIGRHKRSQDPNDPDDSWYLGSGKYLLNAIEKYGSDKFSRRILCDCDSEEMLNERETYYLNLYDCANSPDYYNMTNSTYDGWPILEGENNPFYGKTHTDEVRAHLSKVHKDVRGSNNPNYGKIIIHKGDIQKNVYPAELDEYLLEGWERGRPLSSKSKQSRAMIGNTINTGRVQSEETRAKRAESLKGNTHVRGKRWKVSEEALQNLRKRVYHITCRQCGNIFLSDKPARKYCENCRN